MLRGIAQSVHQQSTQFAIGNKHTVNVVWTKTWISVYLPLNLSILATQVIVATASGSIDPLTIFFDSFANSIGHATITFLFLSQQSFWKLSGSLRTIHCVSPTSQDFSEINWNNAYFITNNSSDNFFKGCFGIKFGIFSIVLIEPFLNTLFSWGECLLFNNIIAICFLSVEFFIIIFWLPVCLFTEHWGKVIWYL